MELSTTSSESDSLGRNNLNPGFRPTNCNKARTRREFLSAGNTRTVDGKCAREALANWA